MLPPGPKKAEPQSLQHPGGQNLDQPAKQNFLQDPSPSPGQDGLGGPKGGDGGDDDEKGAGPDEGDDDDKVQGTDDGKVDGKIDPFRPRDDQVDDDPADGQVDDNSGNGKDEVWEKDKEADESEYGYSNQAAAEGKGLPTAPKGPKVMGQAAQVLVRRMMMTKTPSQAMDRPRIPQWQVTVGPRWI
eukprot:g12964.t1